MMCYNGQGAETGRYFYHRDGLGSVVALSQLSASTVQIVESYAYDIHGRVTIMDSAGADGRWLTPDVTSLAASAVGNPYLFTGRRYDPETRTAGHSGLYYYRARMYHPDLMRFCQPDPIGYADSMNLYQYCLSNPVALVDPYGTGVLRDTYDFFAGAVWGVEYLLAKMFDVGSHYAARGLEDLSHVGTVTFSIPRPSGYTQPVTVDFQKLSTVATAIEEGFGEYAEQEAYSALYWHRFHWIRGSWPIGDHLCIWEKDERGIWRSVGRYAIMDGRLVIVWDKAISDIEKGCD